MDVKHHVYLLNINVNITVIMLVTNKNKSGGWGWGEMIMQDRMKGWRGGGGGEKDRRSNYLSTNFSWPLIRPMFSELCTTEVCLHEKKTSVNHYSLSLSLSVCLSLSPVLLS